MTDHKPHARTIVGAADEGETRVSDPVRRGVPADASTLATLAALTFPLAAPDHTPATDIAEFVRDKLSAECFTGYLADPDRVILVAEVADEMVGYAMVIAGEPSDPDVLTSVAHRPTVDLNKLYVQPGHHGSGVAATLVEAAIDVARDCGARSLWLGVNDENAWANRFYDKHGFAIVGTRDFQVGDQLEHDFVRELPLAP